MLLEPKAPPDERVLWEEGRLERSFLEAHVNTPVGVEELMMETQGVKMQRHDISLAFLAFSLVAAGMVLLVRLLLGARLSATWISVLQCFGFLLLAVLAASGIGLIIGTLVRGEQAALYTGIGLALVTGFTSGIFTLYSQLTPALQHLSRIYPIASANSSLIYLLVGEAAAGYNPTEPVQVIITAATSVTLFAVGLTTYSKYAGGINKCRSRVATPESGWKQKHSNYACIMRYTGPAWISAS